MTLFERVHMPSFAGATEWLNSEPLGPAELRGHVVLVNFWTLTCINWLRQEPYVRAWSQAYRDDGLIVIGVHTPEFSFEHDIDGVRHAIKERAIDYPVAVDNDYAIWSAFDNHYWPALYFVDADGIIRDQHFGEGRYEQSERVIQRLLGVERELVPVEGLGVEAAADWDHLRTPETYLGYWRSGHFASPAAPRSTSAAPTSSRSACASTTGRSPASGRSGARTSCSTRPAGASPSGSTRATRISCCLEERAEPIPFRVLLDGEAPGRVTRRRRRRGRQRRAARRPHVPARAPARRGPRADAGDHVPRARRRGVRVHVRLARWRALTKENTSCLARNQPRKTTHGTAGISEDHELAGPEGEVKIDATDDRERRWYHFRPKPRQRTDLWGFISTWWMVLVIGLS